MAKLAGAAEKAGAKAAGGVASEAETLTLTKLASLAKLQRVMVLTGLGMDVANLLILGYGTYSELKMIDAYADEEKQDYIRMYGDVDGPKRWQQERYTRILGILVRAGLQGAMLAVSMKGAHERIAEARRQAGVRRGALPPTEEFKSGEGVKLPEPPKVGEPEVKEALPPEPVAVPLLLEAERRPIAGIARMEAPTQPPISKRAEASARMAMSTSQAVELS